MRLICIAWLVLLSSAIPLLAQESRPSFFAIDTTAAIDEVVDREGHNSFGVLLDAVVSADFGGGFQGIVRPFVNRGGDGEWNRQVWVATVRYERTVPVGVRVDAGLIPSPIGLANLTLRPGTNPTIAQPSSLFTGLPPLEPRAMRATLLGAVYAYGVQTTVSGDHWDARAAVMDTSPLRTRRVFAQTNPPRFANVVIGGGVTPVVGLRIGGSITKGDWQHAGETPLVTADRAATITTVETEVSFRHTRMAGEWIRDALETSTGNHVASGWYVQGQQTLTPRWFVAGRVERMASPAFLGFDAEGAPLLIDQQLSGIEETVGYRLTEDLTLRASHRARRGFGRPGFDQTFAVSTVWWRRWM
jgi:hypothetical protein